MRRKIKMQRKIRYTVIGVLLIGLIGIGGYIQKGINTNKEVPKGRYIEADITGEGFNYKGARIYSMVKSKEGKPQIYVFNSMGLVAYEQDGEGVWQQIGNEWIRKLQTENIGPIEYITNDKDGNIYIIYHSIRGEEPTITCVAKVEGQEIKKLKIAWKDERNYRVPKSVNILPDGDMLISDLHGIQRYSLSDGSFVKSYEGESSGLIAIDNEIYIINNEQGKVDVYDANTNELKRSIRCENLDVNTRLVAGEEGDVYLAGKFGVRHLTKEGTIWEVIIDGSLASFSMPAYKCEQILPIGKTIFAVFSKNEGGFVIKKYTYSKDIPTMPTKELVAYSLRENAFLRQVISQYQLTHPDVKVTLQVGLEQGSTLKEEDAVKALNTELVAGKGPDLILLDGLNRDTYINKGILEDMSKWAKDSKEVNQCLENIIAAYKVQDKTYGIPIHFVTPMLWGDEKVLQEVKSIEDLAAYMERHPNEEVISYKEAKELICQFGPASSQNWFNEEGELQERPIINFLEAVKELEKQGKSLETKKKAVPSIEELLKPGWDIEDMICVTYDYADVYFLKASGIRDLLAGAAGNEKRTESDFVVLSNQEGSMFEPRNILGINAASKKKDIAKDIIGMALSEVIQGIDIEEGFPVNQLVFEKWIQGSTWNHGKNYGIMISGEDIPDLTLSVQWGYEKELKKYYEQCKELKVPLQDNRVLLNTVVEEAKGYFEGTMTAEEVAKAIMKKTEFYLSE